MSNEELKEMNREQIMDYGLSKRQQRLSIIADALICRIFGEIMAGGFETPMDTAMNDPEGYDESERNELMLAISDELIRDMKAGKISARDSIDICKMIHGVFNQPKDSAMSPREYENHLLNGDIPNNGKLAATDGASAAATAPPPGVTITAQNTGAQSSKLAEFQHQIDMMAGGTKDAQSSIWKQYYEQEGTV